MAVREDSLNSVYWQHLSYKEQALSGKITKTFEARSKCPKTGGSGKEMASGDHPGDGCLLVTLGAITSFSVLRNGTLVLSSIYECFVIDRVLGIRSVDRHKPVRCCTGRWDVGSSCSVSPVHTGLLTQVCLSPEPAPFSTCHGPSFG